MKRISVLLVTLVLCVAPGARAQDAATEERLNKLSGQIEDIIASQKALQKQIDALSREIDSVREQASTPTGNYANQEDLKRVAKATEEIDRKRLEDYEKIRAELQKLGRNLAASAKSIKAVPADTEREREPDKPQKGFEYVVQKGDSLSLIVQAYRDKNIKVSLDQILKANPGLVPEKLRVGQKIFIPAPQS